jgi:hypothetical protein
VAVDENFATPIIELAALDVVGALTALVPAAHRWIAAREDCNGKASDGRVAA